MTKILEKATHWAARLAGARTAVHELHETDRQLRAEHAEAVQARAHVLSAPGPRAEALAALDSAVDQLAQQWAAEHAAGVVRSLAPGFELRADGALTPRPPQLPGYFYGTPLSLVDLARVVPALVKARFREVMLAYDYMAGPPAAERAQWLTEADTRVAEVERQHTDLVDLAASLTPPITLDLLPAVKARREQEARQRALHARTEADRAAREAAVNRQHEPAGTRSVPSPYLAALREGR